MNRRKRGLLLGGRPKPGVIVTLVVMLVWGCLGMSRNGDCYIMPAEQLLDLMAANFSKVRSVVLTQSTQLMNRGEKNPAITFEEKVWIRSPGTYGSRIVSEIEGQEMSAKDIQAVRLDIDCGYRKLLVATRPKDLAARLRAWGIDLESVSLTRLDGIIAFCIGKTPKKGPRLLLEKERFLPLLLSYRAVLGPETRSVEVRFKDYRKVGKVWFPYRIGYSLDGEPVEKYIVLDASFNVPLPSPADTR